MVETIIEISLSMGIITAILLVLAPFLSKIYSAKGRYIIWLIIALRLVIPFQFPRTSAPVNVELPYKDKEIVFRQETQNVSVPFQVMEHEEAVQARQEYTGGGSAEYATVADMEAVVQTIWLWGAVIFILYHLIGYLIFRLKIRKRLIWIKDNIYRCNLLDSPMLAGFFKPVIILPDEEYTHEELEIIIAHETTHMKRHDLWYKLLLVIANGIHWFNPLVYLMVKQANKDIEYSCDEAVVKGKDLEYRKAYSMTVLKTMKRKIKEDKHEKD